MLDKGFGATSIDEIIAASRVSRSGFFYHFKDRNELARALVERYIEQDNALLDELFGRARELHDDPLHAFLIGLKLLSETLADLPGGHPGCLITTFCYAERSFDREVHELNRQAVLGWRERFVEGFLEIATRYPVPRGTSSEALADAVGTTIEGGIILSRAAREPRLLAEQVLMLRSHVKLLFAPPAPHRASRACHHRSPGEWSGRCVHRREVRRPSDGGKRQRLLDVAEAAVLTKGYSATSIEELVAEVEITKSGFFYHFRDKSDLAGALLERSIARDDERLRAHFAAAAERHDDPLERLSAVLERIAESATDTDAGRHGSLVGTFCNTPGVLDERSRELTRQALVSSREPFAEALREVAGRHPMNDDVGIDAVADRIFSTLEGGVVMAKALADPRVFAEQLRLLDSYLGLLFAGPADTRRAYAMARDAREIRET